MTTTNMLRWIEALESGEYQQGQGALRHLEAGTFCCLGVATDVAIRNGVAIAWNENVEIETEDGGHAGTLPIPVQEWLGIEHGNPGIQLDPFGYDQISCITANDEAGWTFEKIAAGLRRTYLREETS